MTATAKGVSAEHIPLAALRRAALAELKPVELLPLSEWLPRTLRLPGGLAAAPGPIRLWKFQLQVAAAMTDPAIERVTVMKGARLGYSTLLVGAIAYYARVEPSSILAVLPTDDDTKTFVVSQLEQVISASPELAGAIGAYGPGRPTAGPSNRLTYRQFAAGSLRVVSARSPRNLRAHSARVLVVDELDAMEPTAEGSPLDLAERRTLSFADRKIIVGSTPGSAGTSLIAAAYEESDQRVFECPCRGCGVFAEIRWADIVWPEGKPAEAGWKCPSCGRFHAEIDKPGLVADGDWRITAPEIAGHAGFRVNCLVAPHAPAAWGRLASEFLSVARVPDRLRVFVNTILGEVWREDAHEGPGAGELAASAEDFGLGDTLSEGTDRSAGTLAQKGDLNSPILPAEVLWITAGCDVQHDRLECTVLGFSEADTWFALGHRAFYGDVLADDAPWADLADFLSSTFPHPSGRQLGIDACCLDAGDGASARRVMAFCAGRAGKRWLPIKGASGPARAPLVHVATRRAGQHALHIVGVDAIKGRLLDRIARRQGIRFSRTLSLNWYHELLSERRTVRFSRGQPYAVFERYPGRNAEALDATTYAIAARSAVTVTADRRRTELAGVPVAPAIPAVVRSSWLQASSAPRY